MSGKELSNVVEIPLCPLWRYTCPSGTVTICVPVGTILSVERANILLDMAKQSLLVKAIE